MLAAVGRLGCSLRSRLIQAPAAEAGVSGGRGTPHEKIARFAVTDMFRANDRANLARPAYEIRIGGPWGGRTWVAQPRCLIAGLAIRGLAAHRRVPRASANTALTRRREAVEAVPIGVDGLEARVQRVGTVNVVPPVVDAGSLRSFLLRNPAWSAGL
jgi:hypothetical protein